MAGLVYRLRWPIGLACFAFGVYVAVGVVRLDREVVARFEGRTFQVPSRVLSQPSVLYPGLDWKKSDLRGTLARLGYRRVRGVRPEPGQYEWEGNLVRLHLRAFDHPTRGEPDRKLEIGLGERRIRTLTDSRGRPLGAVPLEPELVGLYYGPDREQRELVRLDDLPPALVDAILAVEDQRFPSHSGVDPRRIAGALLANLEAGGITQGGSTLTQQLVKNFFLQPERTYTRKLQEAVMALLVEWHYEKPEILEAYLNEIYLGQRGPTAVHGMGQAARLYFGKSARDLDLPECALLAAIIQSPNANSPYRNPDRAVERRNLVLDLMLKQGRIDRTSWRHAKEQPLLVAEVTPDPRDARYFMAALQRQLPEHYDRDVLATEGLRIHATIDLRMQLAAAAALREGLESLEQRYPRIRRDDPLARVQGCVVALRPQTGEVLALVGGRDFGVSQFDRCSQAHRPAGSVFKPFVYLAALEEERRGGDGITLASFLSDEPLQVSTPSGVWAPENYDHRFHGRVPVREALERSMNVATARLAQKVGIERVVEVARRLGIESELPAVPSLALGTADVSPLEMARAYATLANGGVRPVVRTFDEVVDGEGRQIERRRLDFERVLDEGTAYLATSLLQGVIARGTGRGVAKYGLSGALAGKTGTSDEERDAWFVGFTPELVVAVWVGFDAPQSLGLSGSSAALPIWARFVLDATGGEIRGAFLPPQGVERIAIDPETGARALRGCPRRRDEYFLVGTAPEATCPGLGFARGETAGRGRTGRAGGG
ncbi:MAG TPA: PBP1A family penicillin-binding protein [Myxococcota bacterium]|nr:PBP1A family penicillin-binding protein [Myxococcota bacterium]